MSTSKFLKDVCRTIGCDNNPVCGRCNRVNREVFERGIKALCGIVSLDDRLDDLDQIEVVMFAEEQFNIEILDDEWDSLRTGRMCLEFLRKRLGEEYVPEEQV